MRGAFPLHPEWNLEQLTAHIDRGGELAAALGSVSIADVLDGSGAPALHVGVTGVIDLDRLHRASQLKGEAYADIVAEVLEEAGEPVRAGYVRERAGGPRWKINKALTRLCERGLVERRGKTSDTTWLFLGD